jgi:hypothetical protein
MPRQLRSLLAPVLLSFLWACQEAASHGDDPFEGAADGGTIESELGDSAGDLGTMIEGVQMQPAKASFPLRVSDDGRRLVDSAGKPFLINQASSWGLIQSLSTEDARAYLDQLAARGWNTVMVSIISYDERMPGDPPAWRGIDPFQKRWDFSTPNDAYFEHADQILELARERGMLVTLVPSYLGYPEDSTQGWADELLASTNSVDKSRAYGRYLGRRYKGFDNIVWVAGGDNEPARGSELEQHMLAIVQGIRAEDPEHLWTAHWSGKEAGMLASENPTFAQFIDLDGYYAFNYELTYEKVLNQFGRRTGRPLFHLDMSYETEWGGAPAEIRKRAYDAMLSGAAGSSFNAGPDWYLFKNFRKMDTPGTRETQHWFRLFARLPWYELIPDADHTAITDGYGELGSTSYVSAARTPDYRFVMAYLAKGGSLKIDLDRMPGSKVRVTWVDPTNGRTREGKQLSGNGQRTVQAPSAKSWMLVARSL